jgi:integrating conjugative element protein (TIGR03746 family)
MANVEAHNNTLRIALVVAAGVIVMLTYGLIKARDSVTLHVPPDLRSGVALKVGEVPPPNVYAFAYYIFQQLNRWPENGEAEYPERIFKLSAYMTPKFRAHLLEDMERKAKGGELASRTRSMQELAGTTYEPRRVEILSSDAWRVWLDLQLQETVQGMKIKDTVIRYPLRVIRYDVDRERNPWGLALDGFAGKTQRIKPEQLAMQAGEEE